MKRPVLGLVGDICAGKSAVARALARRGARIFDADAAVHALYREPDVVAAVVEQFGPGVLDAAGQVDRRALGARVFADPAALRWLTETVVFPRVGAQIRQALADFQRSHDPALVLDAPTLFEAGRAELCDAILYVTAPWERRVAWAGTRGWDAAELARREARLGDATAKRRHAVVVENRGTLDELDAQVGRIFDRLRGETGAVGPTV